MSNGSEVSNKTEKIEMSYDENKQKMKKKVWGEKKQVKRFQKLHQLVRTEKDQDWCFRLYWKKAIINNLKTYF